MKAILLSDLVHAIDLVTYHILSLILIDSEDECSWNPNISGADKTEDIRCFRKTEGTQAISSIESNGDWDTSWTPLNISIEKHDVGCSAVSSQHCLESVYLHIQAILNIFHGRHTSCGLPC